MSLLAKSIVKNKCWIVEEDGSKIATILANDDGVTYVQGDHREKFPSLKILSEKYNILIESYKQPKIENKNGSLYGYPCSDKIHNELWNLQKKLPMFTKEEKSKSYYCAGYYLVNLEEGWTKMFCPKLITVNRHEFKGPFKSEDELTLYYNKEKIWND